ncbi:TPA: hypothetical protein ACH3X1_012804 [Trebouxia sp. C0004]
MVSEQSRLKFAAITTTAVTAHRPSKANIEDPLGCLACKTQVTPQAASLAATATAACPCSCIDSDIQLAEKNCTGSYLRPQSSIKATSRYPTNLLMKFVLQARFRVKQFAV